MASVRKRPSLMAATTALALFAGAGLLYAATTGTTSTSTTSSTYTQLPTSGTTVSGAQTTTLSAATASIATTTDFGSFGLGVQTHMSQGWTLETIGQAQQVKAGMLRDSLPWSINEKTPGVYDFSGSAAGAIAKACAAGFTVIVTLPPQHPFYDGGKMVHTDAGLRAYARYLKAVIGRYGSCIAGIEVGNEINGAGGPDMLAPGMDMVPTYMGVIKAISNWVKPVYPNTKILGGSTNMIGTGFLDKLFAAGMLPMVDGVVVHPYRTNAQGVDIEITNLINTMKKYGAPKPIWATEWSHDVTDQPLAAGELVKTVALMSASGVKQASWYALLDQTYFPNMGLIAGTAMKQQGLAYEFIQRTLIPQGRAQRVDLGDPLLYAYRFGTNNWVVWGNPRTITLSGGQAFTATGTPISGTSVKVGFAPIVIVGSNIASPGTSNLVADSLLGYGSSQWAYYARTGQTRQTDYPLGFINEQYTSYYGGQNFMPLRINLTRAAPGGSAGSEIRTVLRYTSPTSQSLDMWACLSKSALKGDGIDYLVSVNGIAMAKGITTTRSDLAAVPLNLAAGDKVDFVVGPNQTYGGDNYSFRIQMYKRGTGVAPTCS